MRTPGAVPRRSSRAAAGGRISKLPALVMGLLALLAGLLGAVTPTSALPAGDGGVAPAGSPTGNVVVDPTWRPAGGVGELVAASVLQPDGKLVIVGPFTQVNGVPRTTAARLNPDGSLDATFDAGTGFDDTVRELALQPDGKIIAVGRFRVVDGLVRPLVVRLLPDGSVDPTFTPPFSVAGLAEASDPGSTDLAGAHQLPRTWQATVPSSTFTDASEPFAADVRTAAAVTPNIPDGSVDGVALEPDGKVIVFGTYLNYDGSMTAAMARLNTNGAYDPTFAAPYRSNQMQAVGDVVVAPDGTVLVAGHDFGVGRPILARLTSSGTVDPSWQAPECNGPVWALLRLADGRLLASGSFSACGGQTRRGLLRLDAGGAFDPTFNAGVGFERDGLPLGPDDMAMMPDGKVVTVGAFTTVDAVPRAGAAVLTANGSLVNGIVPAAPGGPVTRTSVPMAWSVHALAGGMMIINGDFGSIAGIPRNGLARLAANGALDQAYQPVIFEGQGVDSWSSGALLQPDGKIVVVGASSNYNGQPSQALVRINPNGTRDPSLSTTGTGLVFVDAIARQPDGKFVVAGAVAISQTAVVFLVMRLNADGSRDPSFAAQRYDLAEDQQIVNTLVLQPDGKVLVAGQFTGPGGRANLMRLNPSGSQDATFTIGTGFTYPWAGLLGVRALLLQPDGRIVAAGGFDAVNGNPRAGIVRLLANGAVDQSFAVGTGFSGTQMAVRVLEPGAGGDIWVAGRFDSYNGQPRQSIARLNSNGSLDTGFAPVGQFLQPYLPTDVTLTSLLPQADGKVIATGSFITFNGVSRRGIVRLTGAGALDPTLDPGTGFPDWSYIVRLLPYPNGTMVAVGQFTGFNEAFPVPLGVTRVAVVSSPPGVPTGLAVTNGDGAVLVTCSPPDPATGGVAQRYELSADNGATWPVTATEPSATLPGLANGQPHQIRVRAANLAGVGPASAAVTALPVEPTATTFVATAPARVVDSRVGSGGAGPIGAGASRVVSVAFPAAGGARVVPVGAVAVAYNVTVPAPGGGGHVRVMPGDAVGLTSASAINFRGGETIANAATVKVDANGRVKVFNGAGVPVDVVIDVVGYFVPAVAGSAAVAPANGGAGLFTAVTPVRVYDAAMDPAGLLGAGADRLVSTAMAVDQVTPVVPAGASAVAYNLTVVDPGGGGHLRVMPGDVAMTSASVINWARAGERIANGAVVRVDSQRRIRVFNGSGAPVRFLVDVVGYYSATGAEFFAIDPVRTTETRPAFGGAGPVAPGLEGARVAATTTSAAGGLPVVPGGASAVAFNATVTGTLGVGHLRVYPANAVAPNASVLNWPGAGYTRANASTVGVSPQREVKLYDGSGAPIDVLIDINGYYQ